MKRLPYTALRASASPAGMFTSGSTSKPPISSQRPAAIWRLICGIRAGASSWTARYTAGVLWAKTISG